MTLEQIIRQHLVAVLAANGWRQKAAAKELGISERVLSYKVRKYRLLDEREQPVEKGLAGHHA